MQVEKCEICGNQFIAGYGYSLAVVWLVTGHAYVEGYMCEKMPGNQHWGCCPEHALQAMQRCLQEHMHVERLMEKHQETGKPRYSEEDAWAKDLGDNFHIVKLQIGKQDGDNTDKI